MAVIVWSVLTATPRYASTESEQSLSNKNKLLFTTIVSRALRPRYKYVNYRRFGLAIGDHLQYKNVLPVVWQTTPVLRQTISPR